MMRIDTDAARLLDMGICYLLLPYRNLDQVMAVIVEFRQRCGSNGHMFTLETSYYRE